MKKVIEVILSVGYFYFAISLPFFAIKQPEGFCGIQMSDVEVNGLTLSILISYIVAIAFVFYGASKLYELIVKSLKNR